MLLFLYLFSNIRQKLSLVTGKQFRITRGITWLTFSALVPMFFCAGTPVHASGSSILRDGDYVVLLHGLGRTSRCMQPLAEALDAEGYRVVNVGYPSRKYPIEKLAEIVGQEIERECTDKNSNIHFVTHSLGGIVVRRLLGTSPMENLGRVVMLSPPNQGSEVVDVLRKLPFFSLIMGPACVQLGTDPGSVPRSLGPVQFDLGVITGNKSFNPLFSHFIPGVDDGEVSVERARVDGMKDFLVVPRTHAFIMRADEVIKQSIYFLRKGHFERKTETEH